MARKTYRKEPLTIRKVLAWADAHYRRKDEWPHVRSGRVKEAPGETWQKINSSLRLGQRGLPPSGSLYALLKKRRGAGRRNAPGKLTLKQILVWADAHHRRTGHWPTTQSGSVHGAPEENWKTVDNLLRMGLRGLPAGLSIARCLEKYRGVRNKRDVPPLTIRQILAWAEAHHRRTGRWPTADSGAVRGSRGETWSGINGALVQGTRGMEGGSTLTRLLATRRGVRNRKALPPLDEAQIFTWAAAHLRRTGKRPTVRSGPIREAPGETWNTVEKALMRGTRGLQGGRSLPQFLDEFPRFRRREE